MPYVIVLALTLCSVRRRSGGPLSAADLEGLATWLFNLFPWRVK